MAQKLVWEVTEERTLALSELLGIVIRSSPEWTIDMSYIQQMIDTVTVIEVPDDTAPGRNPAPPLGAQPWQPVPDGDLVPTITDDQIWAYERDGKLAKAIVIRKGSFHGDVILADGYAVCTQRVPDVDADPDYGMAAGPNLDDPDQPRYIARPDDWPPAAASSAGDREHIN